VKNLIWSIVALASMIASDANAETYIYTGKNYTNANGDYTTAMRITGSITTSSPIPPNSIDFDIRTIATSWSFFDGVQTISDADGVFHSFSAFAPKFTTDGDGNITQADVWVSDDPVATEVNQTNRYIATIASGFPSGFDHGVSLAKCTTVTNGICTAYLFGPRGYVDGVPGPWTIEAPVRDYTAKLPSGTIGSISFTTEDAGCKFDPLPQFLAVDSVSPPPQKGVAPIDGVVDFTITACTPGATVKISVDYGATLPLGAEYWKVGSPWFKLDATVFGSVIKFSITDGGFGDGDGIENGNGVVNGQIVDPGGASIADIFADGFESEQTVLNRSNPS